jgi:hypothetical protein
MTPRERKDMPWLGQLSLLWSFWRVRFSVGVEAAIPILNLGRLGSDRSRGGVPREY